MASYIWRSVATSEKLLRFSFNRLTDPILTRFNFHTNWILQAIKPTILKMPSLSPTMTEGTIIKWLKKEGDSINPGDVLCDIQTDKAVVSMEVEEPGILAKILMPEDSKEIKIGTPIALMVEEGEDWKDIDIPSELSAPLPSAAKAEPEEPVSTPVSASRDHGQSLGPAVRNLMNMYNIAVKDVQSSGPHGRILKGDVLKLIESKKLKPVTQKAVVPPKQPDVAAPVTIPAPQIIKGDQKDFIDIPVSNMRRTIAKRLSESKQTIPHAYMSINCNIDNITSLREKMKSKGSRVSINDFVIKAAAVAMEKVPTINVQFVNEKPQLMKQIDISVAVATEGGLMTPIIKDAVSLGVSEISSAVKELSSRAKEGKLRPEDFTGGTFTISNLGMFGIAEFSAIINPPQSAILAIGSGRPTLDENLKVHTTMNATLSYDSRAVEEIVAAQFMEAFQTFLENPSTMLAGYPIRKSWLRSIFS